ncbi:MAG: FAD-dependent oxidoreductase [Marmoricola sp.]
MTSFWLDGRPAPTPSPYGAVSETDTDVVVVGAGITGMVTAVLLARAGKSVVVLEARSLGAVTTGHTTGKVSLLQGTKLSGILDVQSERVGRSYVEANREGQAWLLRLCDDASIRAERRTAVTYAATPDQRRTVEREHEAARTLGVPTRWTEEVDAPFETFGAVALDDQAQIDPMTALDELARQLVEHGGVLREGSRVVSVSKTGRPQVRTASGETVTCDDLVLATGTPILDRGLYFAKLEAQRSYVLLYDGATAPTSMLLSAGSPSRSLREVVDADGGSHLMVGGEGHVVGRVSSERKHLDALRRWTEEHFPGARETHAWSAQDYRSHDGIPYVGALPRGLGRIRLATGYDKWGLSNGVAAGLRISADILGGGLAWARPMERRVTRPRGAAALLTANAKVGGALALGYLGAETRHADPAPQEGTGSVGRRGLDPVPVATSTVDGTSCARVGVCTHLGGVLHWNDAESTWDCPLHGSRFAPDGTVLEGPATRALPTAPGDD